MDDLEFLAYCETHTDTPRCGFTPSNISRLMRLAGREDVAAMWDKQPPGVVNCDPEEVLGYVQKARERLK